MVVCHRSESGWHTRSMATTQRPVIIEAAINGATRRTTNPSVPLTPTEIAADALGCFDAGAAIVHHHVEIGGGIDAEVARYLDCWRVIVGGRPDALVYPTVHFGPPISYEHLIPLAESGLLRLGITDPGSVNLGRVDHLGVPTGSFVYANSFDTIGRSFELCRTHRLGTSMAIYEPGFLRAALAWWQAGLVPAGSMFKFYFAADRGYLGAPFGLPPTERALDVYLDILGDCDVPWFVSLVGGDVVRHEIAELALARGGHLHVGLEFYGGERRPSNVELVTEAVDLCHRHGYRVADSSQTAGLLGLPSTTPG